MDEVVSKLFVIGVLLFYMGLVVAFLLWWLGQRLGGPGKKAAMPPVLEHVGAPSSFSPPSLNPLLKTPE